MQIYMHLSLFYVFQCLFTKKKRTIPSLEHFNVCLLVKMHYSNIQIREFSAFAICNKSISLKISFIEVAICNKSTLRFNEGVQGFHMKYSHL